MPLGSPLRPARLLVAASAAAALSAAVVPAASAQTPSPAPRLGISAAPRTFYAGQSTVVTVSGRAGTSVILFARSAPAKDDTAVRQGVVPADGTLELPVKPSTDTSVFAAVRGQTGNESIAYALRVRTALTIAAQRTGTRQYVFSGRLLPAAQTAPVSLYRLTDDGTEVLTARTTSDGSTGTYRMSRGFTGGGTYSFVVRTSQTSTNAAGVSKPVRLTLS